MAKEQNWIHSEDGDITVFVAFLITALTMHALRRRNATHGR